MIPLSIPLSNRCDDLGATVWIKKCVGGDRMLVIFSSLANQVLETFMLLKD